MSVLTEAQRDYMDAVLRGNSFHDGIPNADVSPAPPAEVVKTPPHKVQPPPSRTPYFDTVLMDDDDTDRRGHGGKGNRNRGCKKGRFDFIEINRRTVLCLCRGTLSRMQKIFAMRRTRLPAFGNSLALRVHTTRIVPDIWYRMIGIYHISA